jgi:hypothetical protein
LADNAPKLMAEMLNTLAEYGCALFSPMMMRKLCDSGCAGSSEWLIHS